MNIFVLDRNPKLAAQYHCDKHVVKMILETVQIMSTVTGHGYKPTHVKHPSVKWAGESLSNYLWLKELLHELHKEWQFRFGHERNHKSFDVSLTIPNPNIPDKGLTPFAQAMPIERKNTDPIKAYRDYYRIEKANLLKYTKREFPEWLK